MAVHRGLPPNLFTFTTTGLAELHTATLQAFGAAHEQFETALTFDEVRPHLRAIGWHTPVNDEELSSTLASLTKWGLLDVVQNHAANYTTAEEYERKNLQYSLTKRGEAAFEGVQRALSVLASTGALQSAVLVAITDRLDELHSYQLDGQSPDRQVFTALTELESHLEALRSNTKQFNGELQRLLRDDTTDIETFHEVKSATIGYLKEFVTNLDVRKQQIHNAMERVAEHGVTALHHRALRGADLPTLARDEDPGAQWLQQRAHRWEGMRAWFLPPEGQPARIDELRDIARRAIVSLMRVLERISESRRRASSAVADFRTLARWFATAPTETEAHTLWHTAFGLDAARHAHLALDDPDATPPTTSWYQAPRVPVSPLLRTRGRSEHVARTAKVRDVAAIRQRRKVAAQLERAELEAAWQLLATDGVVRLSELGTLDHATFGHLLDLLGRALSSPMDANGCRHGTSADGRAHLVLRPPADQGTATLHSPHGRLTGPDYLVEVRTPAGPAGAPARGEAVS